MLGPAMSETTFCVASHQTSVDSQTLPVRPLATASHINVDRTGRIITRSVNRNRNIVAVLLAGVASGVFTQDGRTLL